MNLEWATSEQQSKLADVSRRSKCADCNASQPTWAATYHGVLLCLSCAGNHRCLGVHISFVRSIHLDRWRVTELLAQIHGGGTQGFVRFLDCLGVRPPSRSGVVDTSPAWLQVKYGGHAARLWRASLENRVAQAVNLNHEEGLRTALKIKDGGRFAGTSLGNVPGSVAWFLRELYIGRARIPSPTDEFFLAVLRCHTREGLAMMMVPEMKRGLVRFYLVSKKLHVRLDKNLRFLIASALIRVSFPFLQ